MVVEHLNFNTQNSVNAEAGRNFFSVNLAWNKLHEQ